MILLNGDKNHENGQMPSAQALTEMGHFNEELVKAGIMLSGEGLHPSTKAKRVRFDGDKRHIIDGPFAEAKEIIAGFWIWNVQSMDEAVAWVKRIPNTDAKPGDVSEVEIRPLFEAADFGADFTPEARAQDERLRQELAARK
jgi:hypothetical protein